MVIGVKLSKYIILYDVIFNTILIYVIKGYAAQTPSPATAVAFVAMHNSITTLLLILPDFRFRGVVTALFQKDGANANSIGIYTYYKFLLISAVCIA